jgi:hypothetical protein
MSPSDLLCASEDPLQYNHHNRIWVPIVMALSIICQFVIYHLATIICSAIDRLPAQDDQQPPRPIPALYQAPESEKDYEDGDDSGFSYDDEASEDEDDAILSIGNHGIIQIVDGKVVILREF